MDARVALDRGYVLRFCNRDGGAVHYAIEKEIGRGGSSIVYGAAYVTNTGDTKHVRIKECYPYKLRITRGETGELCPEEGAEPGFAAAKERMRADFSLANRLFYTDELTDALVNTVDIYEANHTLYVVSVYATENTLANNQPKDVRSRISIVKQVAYALARIHEAGYLYLDVKPDNVLAAKLPLWRAQLFDFDSLVPVGVVPGGIRLSYTKGFAAPELRQGNVKRLGFHTDVFGVGALLFYLLFGVAPAAPDCGVDAQYDFDGMIPGWAVDTHEHVSAGRDYPDKLFFALTEFFHGTLANYPPDRYGDMEQVIEKLGVIEVLADPTAAFVRSTHIVTPGPLFGRERELKELERWAGCAAYSVSNPSESGCTVEPGAKLNGEVCAAYQVEKPSDERCAAGSVTKDGKAGGDECRLLYVTGMGGIGKSALVREFLARCQATGDGPGTGRVDAWRKTGGSDPRHKGGLHADAWRIMEDDTGIRRFDTVLYLRYKGTLADTLSDDLAASIHGIEKDPSESRGEYFARKMAGFKKLVNGTRSILVVDDYTVGAINDAGDSFPNRDFPMGSDPDLPIVLDGGWKVVLVTRQMPAHAVPAQNVLVQHVLEQQVPTQNVLVQNVLVQNVLEQHVLEQHVLEQHVLEQRGVRALHVGSIDSDEDLRRLFEWNLGRRLGTVRRGVAAEPGQDVLIRPGQDAPMQPGQDALIRPGQDVLIQPGQDALIRPGQDVLIQSERDILGEIIRQVGGHTLALELIAKQVAASHLSLSEAASLVERHGFAHIAPEKVGYEKDLVERQETIGNIVATLFDAGKLEARHRAILKAVALFGADGVDARTLQEAMGLESLDDVNALLRDGWMQGALSLHPVVAEVVRGWEWGGVYLSLAVRRMWWRSNRLRACLPETLAFANRQSVYGYNVPQRYLRAAGNVLAGCENVESLRKSEVYAKLNLCVVFCLPRDLEEGMLGRIEGVLGVHGADLVPGKAKRGISAMRRVKAKLPWIAKREPGDDAVRVGVGDEPPGADRPSLGIDDSLRMAFMARAAEIYVERRAFGKARETIREAGRMAKKRHDAASLALYYDMLSQYYDFKLGGAYDAYSNEEKTILAKMKRLTDKTIFYAEKMGTEEGMWLAAEHLLGKATVLIRSAPQEMAEIDRLLRRVRGIMLRQPKPNARVTDIYHMVWAWYYALVMSDADAAMKCMETARENYPEDAATKLDMIDELYIPCANILLELGLYDDSEARIMEAVRICEERETILPYARKKAELLQCRMDILQVKARMGSGFESTRNN
ncbi:MAG: hypothetical protein LBR77_06930 [Lachnospiraceae bacterium]|nr:hypothetical protein [Lachnospiraceae bacterium]